MSYGATQLAAIDRAHERSLVRGKASLWGIGHAGRRAVLRYPVASTATIVVVGLTALKAARASRRAPRVVTRLSTGALGLMRLEGVLTALRSLTSVASRRDETKPPSAKASG